MPMNRKDVKNFTAKKRYNHRRTTNNVHSVLKAKRYNYAHSTNVNKVTDKKIQRDGMWRVKKSSPLTIDLGKDASEQFNVATLARKAVDFETHETIPKEKKSVFDMESPKAGKKNNKSILEMAKESSARHDEIYKALVYR